MARDKASKLYFRIKSGEISDQKLIEFFQTEGFKIRDCKRYEDPAYGVLKFQKKEHREAAFKGYKTLESAGAVICFSERDPRGDRPHPTSTPTVSTEQNTIESFFNPYHFVDVQGFTPRYEFVSHDRFNGHSGRLNVEVECITPLFIPDPDQTRYIITDQTLQEEDDPQPGTTALHLTIDAFMRKNGISENELPLEVLFDPESRKWDRHDPDNHLLSWKTDYEKHPPQENSRWARGEICKANGNYFIRTDDPNARRYAHKQMDFFRVDGRPVIPGSSLRGALRSRIEVLSNACFCGYDNLKNDASHVFRRLDISQKSERDEAFKLVPVVLRRNEGSWQYLKVDQARVLSEHIFNRIAGSGETALGAYYNERDQYYEKISIIGKDEPGKETGLNAYHLRKSGRGNLERIAHKNDLIRKEFTIDKINGKGLTSNNRHKHTFAYSEIKDGMKSKLYAIIRQLKITNSFSSYKIKKISTSQKELDELLPGFVKSEKKQKVTYAISEIKIKTAFDIDTKTQHRAFFLFGKTDFDKALKSQKADDLTSLQIDRFKALLQQRKENARKLPSDSQGINKKLADILPDAPKHNMLAYFSRIGAYLTYTTVPQKPYKHSIRSILQNQDKSDKLGKLACNELDRLCPACQLFGTVNLDEKRSFQSEQSAKRITGLKGKLAFGRAVAAEKAISGELNPVTLKPLGTPKLTYYPFYVVDNRKQTAAGRGNTKFKNYDNDNIRVGRKVYLHHQHDNLDYEDKTPTNMNATIRPVPAGSRFHFTIHFTNLNTYELGLLLYSLNMRYKGEKTGFHLGMGKSLGLGSCRLHLKEACLLNRDAHYRTFLPAGEEVLTAEKIEVLERKYQYVQGAAEQGDFNQRRKKMDNHQALAALQALPETTTDIQNDWLAKSYIHEFHILSSLNVHSQYTLYAPLVFAPGYEKGFEWYQNARGNRQQGLFDPKALEENLEHQAPYQLRQR